MQKLTATFTLYNATPFLTVQINLENFVEFHHEVSFKEQFRIVRVLEDQIIRSVEPVARGDEGPGLRDESHEAGARLRGVQY